MERERKQPLSSNIVKQQALVEERYEIILGWIRERGSIRTKEVYRGFGVSERTAHNYLNVLLEAGNIQRINAPPYECWVEI